MERSVLLVFAFITFAHGQVIESGKCPVVQGVQNFDTSRFEGKWFELERFSSQTETEAKCNVIDYKFGNNEQVDVTFTSILSDGTPFNAIGRGYLGDISGSLNVTFSGFNNGRMVYVVLGTDYDNWATVFACRSVNDNQHQLYLWVLSRNPNTNDAAIIDAENAARSQNLSIDLLELVDHQIC